MGIPTIEGVNMQTVVFLGLWFFVALQFNKGKLWPNGWTGGISLAMPFLLAWVPVYGPAKANAYVQVMAALYLLGTGFWAINKAGKVDTSQQTALTEFTEGVRLGQIDPAPSNPSAGGDTVPPANQ